MECNLCLSQNIKNLGGVGSKNISVTSDSKLCNLSSRIYTCQDCGHMQKQYEKQEAAFIESIYNNYNLYDISLGNEQLVFSHNSIPEPRSFHMLKKCLPLLPETGRLLDFGSGSGVVLRSAGKLLPKWRLSAFDIVNIYEKQITEIPQVEAFITGKIEAIPDMKYDLITAWHVLEHISDPVRVISALIDKMTDQGHIFLQVPDINRYPFDLPVIDHCSHFTNERLVGFLGDMGLEIVLDGYVWTHNCNTLLLKRKEFPEKSLVSMQYSGIPAGTFFYWVNRALDEFEDKIKESDYSIFTAGTASVFLSEQFSRKPVCFIDENVQKEGKEINNIPIIHPANLKKASKVIMPFSNPVSEAIGRRLKETYTALRDPVLLLPPEY